MLGGCDLQKHMLFQRFRSNFSIPLRSGDGHVYQASIFTMKLTALRPAVAKQLIFTCNLACQNMQVFSLFVDAPQMLFLYNVLQVVRSKTKLMSGAENKNIVTFTFKLFSKDQYKEQEGNNLQDARFSNNNYSYPQQPDPPL